MKVNVTRLSLRPESLIEEFDLNVIPRTGESIEVNDELFIVRSVIHRPEKNLIDLLVSSAHDALGLQPESKEELLNAFDVFLRNHNRNSSNQGDQTN